MQLLTRDMPDEIHLAAKLIAVRDKTTLNAFVIEAVREKVARESA